MYEPKSSLVVTITLEFLDTYGMWLDNFRTHDSVITKTNTPHPATKLYVLFNTTNCRSSMKSNLHQPNFGLFVTITLEFQDKYGMSTNSNITRKSTLPLSMLQKSY
jgi:hypothetical protein